ncbi:hypothetical protein TNCV_432681 [Trichonephila clavipes]|nr:hypothetical protein TNCV_432681 [Trichonephila clavipes]
MLNESKDVFRLGGEPTPFVKHFIDTGNTAENSVPDKANDVDATPETDSSTKPEGNASVVPKDRASGSRDMRIRSAIGVSSRPKLTGIVPGKAFLHVLRRLTQTYPIMPDVMEMIESDID